MIVFSHPVEADNMSFNVLPLVNSLRQTARCITRYMAYLASAHPDLYRVLVVWVLGVSSQIHRLLRMALVGVVTVIVRPGHVSAPTVERPFAGP